MSVFTATYRLQLGPMFGFEDVLKIIPYLERLGISHLYLSPIWQARAGSTHGYDIVDPAHISHELGGEQQFLELAATKLGIVLDVVPNHMAADDANPYWSDERLRSKFFDIDEVHGFRRRFFDVDDLVGVRMEDPVVFSATHDKLGQLITQGVVDGLRIDHIDGLADPGTYLERLQQLGATHVWVEKILEPGEQLHSWPVEGTTGYDFLNDATALFVDPTSEEMLTQLSGEQRSFTDIAQEAKLEQVASTFVPEVERLRTLLDVPEVAPALASLPVYRTYVNPSNAVTTDADQSAITHLPEPIRSTFLKNSASFQEFITRFQQTTGAVMAKGVEDTALYRYVRLLALNEVGGDPGRFHLPVEAFHLANIRRAEHFPRALLASQTHDTKRSGDVRARLIALSHVAEDWTAAVQRWHQIASKWQIDGSPDWTEELFIYQTLIGGWPIGMDRLAPYLRKALREAKRNTSWTSPNEDWEQRVIAFCQHLHHDKEFLKEFVPFADQIALAGEQISLSQLVLRLSVPGVPDIYQGDEVWNLSFVDPDNRRPVAWDKLERALDDVLDEPSNLHRENAKLFVTQTMLALRQRHLEAFHGTYEPLPSSSTTCAYRRGSEIIVAVNTRGRQAEINLPDGGWNDVLAPLHNIYSPVSVTVYEAK